MIELSGALANIRQANEVDRHEGNESRKGAKGREVRPVVLHLVVQQRRMPPLVIVDHRIRRRCAYCSRLRDDLRQPRDGPPEPHYDHNCGEHP